MKNRPVAIRHNESCMLKDLSLNLPQKDRRMKRYFESLMVLAAIVIAMVAGCKKNNNGPAGPNVSNFSATAPAAYTIGSSATVVVNSTSLAAGNYTLKYHYTDGTAN